MESTTIMRHEPNMADLQGLRGALLALLLKCHGRSHAVTGHTLAVALRHRDDRAVRQTIRELIAGGYPIASATDTPAGYFMVETLAEGLHYMQGLRSRLIADALRRRDFKRGVGLYFDSVKQGRLV